MNNLKRISAAVLAGMALMSASGVSHGMGFGHASSRAILGDSLRVTVPVRLEAGEELTRECLAADVYLGEDKVAPKVILIDLLPGEGGGDRSVVISSSIAISEPVVTIYLAAGCQSRVTRKIVLFPDPPTLIASPTTTPVDVADKIESASLPVASNVSAPGALPTALPPVAAPAASPSRKAGRASATAKAHAGSVHGRSSGSAGTLPSMVVADVVGSGAQTGGKGTSKSKSAQAETRKRGAAAQAKALNQGDGGRLLLDPVDADAMVIPDLRMTPTLGAMAAADENAPEVKARRDAAAALWLALNASPEQMARDRDRLQELEQRLSQLQKEGDQAKQSVRGLQARVQAAESQRAGRWTYLLALLAVAASVTAAYLYMRLRRVGGGNWWQASEHSSLNEQEPELEAEEHTSTEFVHVPDSQPGAYPAATSRSAAAFASIPAAPLASEPHRPLASASLHQMVPDAPAPFPSPSGRPQQTQTESLREVSVEELIDLEQQAEFFVVLGQDDAAIDLLESHVLHTTGASPLPFLKLLEIYRRVGKRAEYERVQAGFNQRFNAYAPAWDADLQQGHSLADYPGVVERLQSLWPTPAEAMVVLEKSLTRPESGEDTFELPAYRELLFLYAVARDLSEREVSDRHSVDLLLPVIDISGAEPSTSVHHQSSPVIEPLMATRPIKAQPEVSPSIKLDLQLDDDLPPADPPH